MVKASVVNPQKDEKATEIVKGTIDRGDVPFPYMVKGTVSQKKDGTCKVLTS